MSEVKTSKKGDIVKVILAIVAILMGTYIFVDPGKSSFTVDPAVTSKADSLQKINDSLVTKNLELDSLLDDYRLTIYDLDYKLTNLSKRRSNVDDYFKDRNRQVDQENSSLDTFFMNRYEYTTPTEE